MTYLGDLLQCYDDDDDDDDEDDDCKYDDVEEEYDGEEMMAKMIMAYMMMMLTYPEGPAVSADIADRAGRRSVGVPVAHVDDVLGRVHRKVPEEAHGEDAYV